MAEASSKRLKDQKEKILSLWEKRVSTEIESAEKTNRLVIRNSLPSYLDNLSEALALNRELDAWSILAHDKEAARIGKLHGAARADNTDFALTEIIFEYHILREVIFQVLESDGALACNERDIILNSVEQAVNNAAVEFSEINKEIQLNYFYSIAFERHKLESIFRVSHAAMALWRGPLFIFEMVNPAFQMIFEGRQLLGKTFIEAVPEMAHQDFPDLLKKVFETGESYTGREVLARIKKTPSGNNKEAQGGALEDRYFDFKYIRVNNLENLPYGVYVHAIDVTDRVLARTDLEASKTELQLTVNDLLYERELRDFFVATLTHDLQNPITAAKLSGDFILRDPRAAEATKKVAKKIIDNLNRLTVMIHDLLDASRIQAGEPLALQFTQCDLSSIIREVVDEMVLIHGDRFIRDIKGPVEGSWDCDALRRTLENLIGNAVKYGAADKPITISLRSGKTAVEMVVHNEGPPLPADEIPRLFQRFRRSKSAHKEAKAGWGLGLTLVKGVVDGHKGKIRVESSKEKGTSFILEIPYGKGAATLKDAKSA